MRWSWSNRSHSGTRDRRRSHPHSSFPRRCSTAAPKCAATAHRVADEIEPRSAAAFFSLRHQVALICQGIAGPASLPSDQHGCCPTQNARADSVEPPGAFRVAAGKRRSIDHQHSPADSLSRAGPHWGNGCHFAAAALWGSALPWANSGPAPTPVC
jgi:hypothetical protein